MTKAFLRAYAVFIGLTCIPLAMAAIPVFTGPTGTNPASFPAAIPDLNTLIGSINSSLGAAQTVAFTANGSVATTVTSLGPTGSHTTIQEWATITDAAGTTRYIPLY